MIRNKREYYRRAARGDFGNVMRTWSSFGEVELAGYLGPLSLRYAGQTGSGRFSFNHTPGEARAIRRQWVDAGLDARRIILCETLLPEWVRLQGEVQIARYWVDLHYSTERVDMRQAMRRAGYASGAPAMHLLRTYLDPASFDDMMDLLGRYPDHVVEFTAADRDIGTCPHRNTVIWEVRHY